MSKIAEQKITFKEQSLKILGYKGENVANTFFRQEAPTKHLAIILPGAGYSARMPLLYYTVNVFLDHHADLLTVDYDYRSPAERRAPDFQERLTENVTAAIKEALIQHTYEQVTLIGKSIGTRAMSWLLSKINHPLTGISSFRSIWLTPAWSDPEIFSIMKDWTGESLHIIGTGDHYYYRKDLADQLIERKNIDVVAIPDADHSLDIDGDITRSLQCIETAVKSIESFVFESKKASQDEKKTGLT